MDQNVNHDMSERSIINSAYDITNVVPIEQEKERIVSTARKCFDILADHCGPHSDYAMLVDNNSIGLDFRPNVFTRDGIGIMKAVEFASPLQRYIKDLITYIGQRVDSMAKDGTTTAMMIASALIANVVSSRSEKNSVSLAQRQRELKEVIDRIIGIIDSCAYETDLMDTTKVSEQEAMRRAGDIAYVQALSSSGGNRDLADAMREIFSQSPRSTWEFLSYKGSIKENDRPFSVDVDEFDFALKCMPGLNAMLQDTLGTEYIAENVRCYIYADALVDGDMRTEIFLGELAAVPKEVDVSVFVTSAGRFASRIKDLNVDRQQHPICVWEYASPEMVGGQSMAYDLMILAAQTGITPVDHSIGMGRPLEYFVAPKLHWYAPAMHFYDCVPTEKDSCLHPYFAHPEQSTEYYREVLQTCQAQLDLYANGHRPDGKMEDFFRNVLNRLITVKRPTLRLGGTTHEQIANRDVAQDVQGAIMATLTHGCVLGFPVVYSRLKAELKDETGPAKDILDAFEVVKDALFACNSGVSKTEYDKTLDSLDLTGHYAYVDGAIVTMGFDTYMDNVQNRRGNEYLFYPPIQPVVMYRELLRRVAELIYKFAWSNQIVVYGALLVEGADKKADKEDNHGDHRS